MQKSIMMINHNKSSFLILCGLALGFASTQREKIIKATSYYVSLFLNWRHRDSFKEKFESLSEQEQQQIFKQVIHKYSKKFEESKVLENIIEKEINPSSQIGKLSKNFTYTCQDSSQNDLQKALCEPVWEMLSRGGKRIRPIFCALIAESFGRKFEDVMDIAGLIEVLHNSSLIIDDIEDNSLMRREKKAVHIIYGVDLSINAGNYAYFAPFNYLLGLKKYNDSEKLKLSRVYAQEMTQIHFGQAWDLLWHNLDPNQRKFPSEDQYFQMVIHKTGLLFRMMAKMTSIVLHLSQQQEDRLSSFTEKIGAAFQIQDDIINIDSHDYKSKGITGEDICEGKITLMVIHFLERERNEEKKKRFVEILSMKTRDQSLINEAISYMHETNSIFYAKEFADRLMNEAWEELDQCLPESDAKYHLKLICEFVTKRSN